MSAQIVQFGKPQSLTAAAKRYAEASRRRVRRSTVRFALDGELYEVEFYGNAVRHVFAIQYRISGGGVQEMKRTHWYSECLKGGDLDAAIVEAAWRVRRGGDGSDVEAPFRERALTQLYRRHAKLVREVAMVEATIASMQHGLN